MSPICLSVWTTVSPEAKCLFIASVMYGKTSVKRDWLSSLKATLSRFRAKPSMKYWVRSGLRATPSWLKKPKPPLSSRTATSGQARAAALPSALSSSASRSISPASRSISARRSSGRSWKMRIWLMSHSLDGLKNWLSGLWPAFAAATKSSSAFLNSGLTGGPAKAEPDSDVTAMLESLLCVRLAPAGFNPFSGEAPLNMLALGDILLSWSIRKPYKTMPMYGALRDEIYRKSLPVSMLSTHARGANPSVFLNAIRLARRRISGVDRQGYRT